MKHVIVILKTGYKALYFFEIYIFLYMKMFLKLKVFILVRYGVGNVFIEMFFYFTIILSFLLEFV